MSTKIRSQHVLSAPTETPYDVLSREISGYIDYSRIWMRVWAFVSYLLRTSLIVVSAVVAEKAELLNNQGHLVAILSLSVAVGTSLDTWLKTGTRYKGHYTFHDMFIALYTCLELTNRSDPASLDKIKDQFTELIDDYALAVLPT